MLQVSFAMTEHVYDDRAFDHGPVHEGSTALARIGGVIRPLVEALGRW